MRAPLLGILVLMLAGCTILDQTDPTPTRLDTLATKIKTRLVNDMPLAAAAVQVDQQNGVIYLRGFADDAATKQRLEAVARKDAGDRKIVNQIEIK